MARLDRCFTNLLADDVNATASFYEALFGFTRHFDSDWFVILVHDGMPGFELGILDRSHPVTPPGLCDGGAGGSYLTFVVEDVDAVHTQATELGATVVAQPENMAYGQRRLLIQDPNGVTLDISAPVRDQDLA